MSLSFVPSGNHYRFKSLERLRRFLNLESPYDACLACQLPRSKSAASKNKTEIPDILNILAESAVPSPEAAGLLHDLSELVICTRKHCWKQAPLCLYEAWCDKLWRCYLQARKLSLTVCGNRPIGFTKEVWESAIEEKDDSASDDSAYGSNCDDPYADPDYDPDDDPDSDWDEDGSTDADEDTDTESLGIESLSIKSKARTKTKLSFSRYRQISHDDHRKKLFNLLISTITSDKNRYPGYIYGFRRPDLPGYIKIGYVKDKTKDKSQTKTVKKPVKARLVKKPVKARLVKKPVKARLVKTRLAEWRSSCKHEIKEVFSTRIECNAIQRMESLIHTTLYEYRQKQNPPCEPCRKRGRKRGRKGKHDEWFKVDENLAIKVVNFWARFAQLKPYKLGRLTNFWHEDIHYQMFSEEFPEDYPVMSWMEAMTPLIEILAERKSPGRWKV